jgi:hypothetical protein
VVMTISFEASDRIIPVEAEVVDQSLQQFLLVRHGLQAWEKTRFPRLGSLLFVSLTHVCMISDLANANTRLWVRVQNPLDKVLAVRREELGHLIVSAHNLFVKVRSLWILERQVSGHHRVKNYTRAPDISLKSVVTLSSDHLHIKTLSAPLSSLEHLPRVQHSRANHKLS